MLLQQAIFTYAVASATLAVGIVVIWVLYCCFVHPLSRYPGPWLWSAFRFPQLLAVMNGTYPHKVKAFHDKYGPIVRTAPDELSFADPAAWDDIFMRKEWTRPSQWRGKMPGVEADNLISADNATHDRIRKAFAPAFSNQAVNGYEESIQSHTSKLLDKISSMQADGPLNIQKWLSFTLFDTMMEIGWSTSFDLLGTGDYHPWVTALRGYQARLFGVCLSYYPFLAGILSHFQPPAVAEALKKIFGIAREIVTRRLDMQEPERRDCFSHVLGESKNGSSLPMAKDELYLMSMTLVVVGSEPVLGVLCGAINHLLHRRNRLERLQHELRSQYTSHAEISAKSTQSLPYLNAVIKEALRLCPGVPDSMRRKVVGGPDEVHLIAGCPVPSGTVVSVACWSMFTSEANFTSAKTFSPERWLQSVESTCNDGSEKIPLQLTSENEKAYRPFSCGSRGCLGQNLAMMELRILLARLLFEYDLAVDPVRGLFSWEDQRILWEWDKKPLFVRLKKSDRALKSST